MTVKCSLLALAEPFALLYHSPHAALPPDNVYSVFVNSLKSGKYPEHNFITDNCMCVTYYSGMYPVPQFIMQSLECKGSRVNVV